MYTSALTYGSFWKVVEASGSLPEGFRKASGELTVPLKICWSIPAVTNLEKLQISQTWLQVAKMRDIEVKANASLRKVCSAAWAEYKKYRYH